MYLSDDSCLPHFAKACTASESSFSTSQGHLSHLMLQIKSRGLLTWPESLRQSDLSTDTETAYLHNRLEPQMNDSPS